MSGRRAEIVVPDLTLEYVQQFTVVGTDISCPVIMRRMLRSTRRAASAIQQSTYCNTDVEEHFCTELLHISEGTKADVVHELIHNWLQFSVHVCLHLYMCSCKVYHVMYSALYIILPVVRFENFSLVACSSNQKVFVVKRHSS